MVIPTMKCENCETNYRKGSKHECKDYCVECHRNYKMGTKHVCRYKRCDGCDEDYKINKPHDCAEVKRLRKEMRERDENKCGICGKGCAFDESNCGTCDNKIKKQRDFARAMGMNPDIEIKIDIDDWKILGDEYKKDCRVCGDDLREYYNEVNEIKSHNTCPDCEKKFHRCDRCYEILPNRKFDNLKDEICIECKSLRECEECEEFKNEINFRCINIFSKKCFECENRNQKKCEDCNEHKDKSEFKTFAGKNGGKFQSKNCNECYRKTIKTATKQPNKKLF